MAITQKPIQSIHTLKKKNILTRTFRKPARKEVKTSGCYLFIKPHIALEIVQNIYVTH